VLQGLTLRPLIKVLRVKADGREHEQEQAIRIKIASKLIEHIEENYSLALSNEVLDQIKTKYEIRIQRLGKDPSAQKLNAEQIEQLQNIQQELLGIERSHLISLRKQSKISDEILRKIEYELDLEETRMMLERNVN
jgi:CPA1 family monovalent cation:H+ antiporter